MKIQKNKYHCFTFSMESASESIKGKGKEKIRNTTLVPWKLWGPFFQEAVCNFQRGLDSQWGPNPQVQLDISDSF